MCTAFSAETKQCIHLHKQELGTGRSLFDDKTQNLPFSLPADIHDASDIADCSYRHMSHVTSVLEHRSPKCKGPGSRGRGGVLFNHEREKGGEQIFRPVIV